MKKVLIGCGAIAVLGVLAIIAVVVIGAAMSGGGGNTPNQGSPQNPPGSKTIVVRLSGTAGLPYSGSYGTANSGQKSVDGTLEDKPIEYNLPSSGPLNIVTATFQKKAPEGTLKVEIVINGKVEKELDTTAEYGVVSITYP